LADKKKGIGKVAASRQKNQQATIIQKAKPYRLEKQSCKPLQGFFAHHQAGPNTLKGSGNTLLMAYPYNIGI
jgi:hypothetical protein